MFASGKDPGDIIEEKGLVQISDVNTLMTVVAEVLASNPKSVEDFRSGRNGPGLPGGTGDEGNQGKQTEMVNRFLKENSCKKSFREFNKLSIRRFTAGERF